MNYPSNISRRQFELVRPILEGARQSTRPRKYDLYDLFCAVAYVLKATVQVAKRNELHKFEVLPQRWIIERSFSWLDKCRRLWKNCERHLNSSRQMIILAFLILLLKRF